MFALLQGPTQLACWTFSYPMRQFLNAFPLREGGGQRPGWMCLIEALICAADSSFSFLWPSHKSPYRFEDPSCAFGAALLQGPTQLACQTFSRPMKQFLNAFPLREGPTRGGLSDICFHTADGLLFAFSFRKVFVGAPEAFFEGDFGLPLEIAFGFGVAEGGTIDVALSGFIVGGNDLFA